MRIKLGGLCNITVHTDSGSDNAAQCAAVSTQVEEMRLPSQKPEPPIRMAA